MLPWNGCQILHQHWLCAPTQQGRLLVHPASGSCPAPMQSLGSRGRSLSLLPGIWQQPWAQTQQMARGTALVAPCSPMGTQQQCPGWGRQGRGRHDPWWMASERGQECSNRSSSCPGRPCLQGSSNPPSRQDKSLLVSDGQSSTPVVKRIRGSARQPQCRPASDCLHCAFHPFAVCLSYQT